MISAVDKAEQKALKEIRKIPQDSDVITTAAFEKAKRDAGRDVCPFGLAFLPCACACYLRTENDHTLCGGRNEHHSFHPKRREFL